jgi:4-diphosphocytidyl-2-C-methyl-D-erythritol kinase
VSDPVGRLHPVIRLAPAKLNLTLAVVGRRPDGFHALHSVMVALALADRLSLAPIGGRTDGADTLHVEGLDAGPPPANLVLRAIAATRDAVGSVADPATAGRRRPPALAARLEKRIPVAAGLGGGSSDAAAAIDGALEAWGAELSPGDRVRVAASVGSDVPFFVVGEVALVEGRGERVRPLKGIRGPAPGVLLVTPLLPVSTADVFAVYAAGVHPEAPGAARLASEHLAGELDRGLAASALLDRAGILASANDLVPATARVVPALVPFRRALTRRLGRPVGQSGSGPSLWALYPSHEAAVEAAGHIGDALADGTLTAPGDGAPGVIATTIRTGEP